MVYQIIRQIVFELKLLNDISASEKEVQLCFINKLRDNIIDLTRWDLEYLPTSIRHLKDKDTLFLTRIPRNIRDFPHIHHVKLVKTVDPLADIKKLLKVKYGNDRAVQHPFLHIAQKEQRTYDVYQSIKEIQLLNFVRKLDLSGLDLEILPDLRGFDSLEELDLSNNRISHIDQQLYQLRNLRKLDLSNNRIESIEPGIGSIGKLEILSLQNNWLSDIPENITQLTMLKKIDLRSNNFLKAGSVEYRLNPLMGHCFKTPDKITLNSSVVTWLGRIKKQGTMVSYDIG